MKNLSRQVEKQQGLRYSLEGQSLHMFLNDLSNDELLILEKLLSKRLSRVTGQTGCSTNSEYKSLQSLSSRETQVLTLIANGYTRSEVADALNITQNTAATHIASIYRKLDIRSVAEATLHACRWGLVK